MEMFLRHEVVWEAQGVILSAFTGKNTEGFRPKMVQGQHKEIKRTPRAKAPRDPSTN